MWRGVLVVAVAVPAAPHPTVALPPLPSPASTGRRNFADFLAQYLPPRPGRYVDAATGADLGPCADVGGVTHGQRPGIGGAADRVYAVGKDVVSAAGGWRGRGGAVSRGRSTPLPIAMPLSSPSLHARTQPLHPSSPRPPRQVNRVVYVAQGRDHPALLCTAALLRTPHWLSPSHAAALAQRGELRCQYRARYGQQPRPCTLYPLDAAAAAAAAADAAASAAEALPAGGGALSGADSCSAETETAAAAEAARLGFHRSVFSRLQPEDSRTLPSYLVARFDEPAAAITPQQAFVLYDGEQCLGTALIAAPGRSLHERQATEAAAAATEGGEERVPHHS